MACNPRNPRTIQFPPHSLQGPQFITQHWLVRYGLLCYFFQPMQAGYMLFAFIILWWYEHATDGKHLPLEARELFIGLQSIEVCNSGMCCCWMQIKKVCNIDHPFRNYLAILLLKGVCGGYVVCVWGWGSLTVFYSQNRRNHEPLNRPQRKSKTSVRPAHCTWKKVSRVYRSRTHYLFWFVFFHSKTKNSAAMSRRRLQRRLDPLEQIGSCSEINNSFNERWTRFVGNLR